MSRRLRTTEVLHLFHLLEVAMRDDDRWSCISFIDGKPLVVGAYSKDPDSRCGCVATGRFARGYKLHAVYNEQCIPQTWEVTPLNEAEPLVATRLVLSLGEGGYLLGDKSYDSNPLHEIASCQGYQLLAARKRPKGGLAHCHHAPGRLRSIELLGKPFGQEIYALRACVERRFARLTNHGGGLAPLPNWVRRSHRVRLWVQAKLILHALYCRLHRPPLPAVA